MEKNLKTKLDKLLVEGHIDIDEYKHIIASINKKRVNKSDNKKIIIFSIILLIIAAIIYGYLDFIRFQKIKKQQELQEELQYDIDQANRGFFNYP